MILALLLSLGLHPPPAEVEIIRTAHGVPHIRAGTLAAMGYGLGWVMSEDHGAAIGLGLLRARGELSVVYGRDSLDKDLSARRRAAQALTGWPRLDPATRDVYQGFAEAVNAWLRRHPDQAPPGMPADFAGWDVLARDVISADLTAARRTLDRAAGPAARGGEEADRPDPDTGSNAWALAPGRTASGRAILLRNPHLNWDAGYYEAHVTVPGIIDFYGDFRVGGPFTVIGGFNAALGWSTTNNSFDDDEVYALEEAPGRPDHVLIDGAAMPLTRETISLRYRGAEGLRSETRELWTSPLGPVVTRAAGRVYVVRTAGDGEFRSGEQFLRMMRAASLDAWREAMRMQARAGSNFTYADRAGNVFYVWNALLPRLPHPAGRDSVVIPVRASRDVWTRLLPWDSLPQLLNPAGGYLQNANDPPHFTTLAAPLDSAALPLGVPGPALSLRSQLSLDLIHGADRLSLEEVVTRKHSYRMLLAERVKDDLLAAVAASGDTAALLGQAAEVLARWDNTVAPDARGGVLFEAWWRRYARNGPEAPSPWARPWDRSAPTTTPDGLRDPTAAVRALTAAAAETRRRYGALDIAWGQVHRIRIAGKDIPVGGCSGALGCFRVLQFREEPDGTRTVSGGDGWILAVEFGDTPRAVSVLAYGNSSLAGNPLLGDQAELFARGELKPVLFVAAEVDAGALRRYRPE